MWPSRVFVMLVVGAALVGCAGRSPETADRLASQPTTSGAPSASTTSSTWRRAPASSTPTTAPPRQTLQPIFSFLGERVWQLEAIGYDVERRHYVVHTKSGEGGPSVEYRDTLPPMRPFLALIDDGGGRTAGEGHMIVRGFFDSFDVYWTERGEVSVQSMRNGWTAEFDQEVLFLVDLGELVLVGTGQSTTPESQTVDRIHLVESSGFVRSIEAPAGLLTVQIPVHDTETSFPEPFETCGDDPAHLESNTPGVDSWQVDTTHRLLTACAGGVPISTTPWCCGMGEFSGTMDSNRDGVEEVFVGGTSVGGGGAGVYTLVDGSLAPLRTDDGEEFSLLTGDVGSGFFRHGCRDGHFVQVGVTVDGESATAERTFFRFEGHHVNVVATERLHWEVEAGVTTWQAHDVAPPEIVSDLIRCQPPVQHELVGTNGLYVSIRPHPLSNAATCEVQWPRPYSPLILTSPDGDEREWDGPSDVDISLHSIAPDDFIATEDGRFALLDYFPCSHEGTIKSIYVGRYDPPTGELIEWRRVEAPSDFVKNVPLFQRHPDRLVIDDDGAIVGELDTAAGTLQLVLG